MKQIIIAALVATTLASCSNSAEDQAKAHQQTTIDSLKTEMVKKQMADSITQAVQLQQSQAVDANSIELANGKSSAGTSTTVHHVHHSSGTSSSGGSGSSGSTASTSNSNSTATTTTAPAQKKGWSAKAKGAIIGAGAGAITGAMVDKRKGEGAIVGGVLGAGAGVGVGAIIDKSQKNKEEREKANK